MIIHYSPYDLVVLLLVIFHLLFSILAAFFLLRFHFRSSSQPPSLRRRLHLLLRLNSLWPVRLLLVLFGSLLSFSELLRLPHRLPHLCMVYALLSHSFAEPAFFATLIFLLRSSTHSKPSSSFLSAASFATSVALPFLVLFAVYLVLAPYVTRKLYLPPDLLFTPPSDDRCNQTLFGTVLLAVLGAGYMPMFIAACWNTVTVVINKRLRVRLYVLTAVVVVGLAVQVTSLALSSLWDGSSRTGQVLGMVAFVALMSCIVAGEGILVVQPVVDALAIVGLDRVGWRGMDGGIV